MGPRGRLGAREARDSVWDPRFGLDASLVNFMWYVYIARTAATECHRKSLFYYRRRDKALPVGTADSP